MNRLIHMLAHGKETVKAVGQPCLLAWDPDYQSVRIKDIRLQLNAFKQFVQDGIKSTEMILQERLFFGMNLPTIDLRTINDEYGKSEPEHFFPKKSTNILPNGREFMFNLMKSANSSKHLIDAQGHWNMVKVMEYLKGKKKFLRKLMKDVYFTGGQQFRGFELGSIKYKNTESCSRNYAISNGEALIATEYHKARVSTNYSFHVVHFLPVSVTILMTLYLIYIRPFAKMLFNNIRLSQQPHQQQQKKKKKHNEVSHSVQNQAGQRQKIRRRSVRAAGKEEAETFDRGYIFCSDEHLNQCWTGVQLSQILQEESLNQLGTKVNLWAWWHIIIGITTAHLEEIAPFFSRDEKACREKLETNIYFSIFPWQAEHQRRINMSVYDLDAAFPGQIQSALLQFYRQISRIWHYWFGLLKLEEFMDNGRIKEWIEKNDSHKHTRKRQKVMDSETQVTSKKKSTILDIRLEDSPVTKAWIRKAREVEAMVRKARR